MSVNRYANRIAICMAVVSLLLIAVMFHGEALGLQRTKSNLGYEERLFDVSRVHDLDILMDSWQEFLDNCESEDYFGCSVVIDGERLDNVAIRGKGNTSLSNVRMMGSQRYSLKLEFDHYQAGKTYYGLDKLCLNNLIQDNTYMKDYLTYRLMNEFDVPSSLCSYVRVKANGEPWGLFLAIEGVEEGFLQRNYGRVIGSLYKPDGMGPGGGPGKDGGPPPPPPDMENGGFPPPPDMGNGDFPPPPGMGSQDVLLQYIDDDLDSYANIFASAKTHVTRADQIRLIRSLKDLSENNHLGEVLFRNDVLRYFVVHNYTVNGDSYTGGMIHNYYLYEDAGRLSMIPWDYNLAFGSFQNRSASDAVNDPIDTPLSVSGDGSHPMIDWIFSKQEYVKRYHKYFSDFLEIDVQKIIDDAYRLIAPEVASKSSDPTHFCSKEEFTRGVNALREFCKLRTESIKGQLSGQIPTTDAGQREQSEKLIDASSLDLSAMGSMGMPGGPPPGNRPAM